jgi:hypothetical protein
MNLLTLKMACATVCLLWQINLFAQIPDNRIVGGRIYEWMAPGKWNDIGEATTGYFVSTWHGTL